MSRSRKGKIAKRPQEEKTEAIAMIELGFTYAQVSKELNIPEGTIKGWVAEYKMSGTKLPEHVLEQMQNELVESARRRFQILKSKYGEWAMALSEDVFEIATAAAAKLKEELSKESDKINHNLLYRLSGTVHYMIGDATLLAGMPTQRQVVMDETADMLAHSAPPMELEERAGKLIELAESMKRQAEQQKGAQAS